MSGSGRKVRSGSSAGQRGARGQGCRYYRHPQARRQLASGSGKLRAGLPAGHRAAQLGAVAVGEDDHLIGRRDGSGNPMLVAEVEVGEVAGGDSLARENASASEINGNRDYSTVCVRRVPRLPWKRRR